MRFLGLVIVVFAAPLFELGLRVDLRLWWKGLEVCGIVVIP